MYSLIPYGPLLIYVAKALRSNGNYDGTAIYYKRLI
ncbi:GNAT family acetyltransferase [Acinetobacter pittii]|nr:GNAT family acetyltransferase [Acinetobacter pittii]